MNINTYENEHMNIIVILNKNPYHISGPRVNRLRTLIEGLAKNGAIIDAIVIDGPPFLRKDIKKNNPIPNVNITYITIFLSILSWKRRFLKYFIQPLFRKLYYYKIKKIIQGISPDFIWIDYDLEPLIVFNKLMAMKNKTYKTIIALDDYDDALNAFKNCHSSKDNQKMELFRNEVIHHIDIFVIMTRTLINHFKSLSNNRGHYIHIPMTVDHMRFKFLLESSLEKPYILYCGSLINSKDGVDILIKSFINISSFYPYLKLYLIGETHPDISSQKKIIAEYNMNERVIHLGPKHRDEIPRLLKGAMVLALARPDSRLAQGGFPTKLGEYLATGKPVCVTRTGEIEDYLTDNFSAFLAEPGSVDSFTDALVRVLTDPANAARVGKNGRMIAEKHFNMDVQAIKLFNSLNNFIQDKSNNQVVEV